MVGRAVLDALLDPAFKSAGTVPVKLFLLVRPSALADKDKRASTDHYSSKGVLIVEGDVTDVATTTSLLRTNSIHTVVSVIGYGQGALHYPLLEACKAAGVRHFLPSDYSIDIDAAPVGSAMYESFAKDKQEVHAAIRRSGMDWTFMATGVFVEGAFLYPTVGVDLAARTVTAPVSFDTAITLTPVKEIGVLTAAAIVDPAARNQQLYFGRQYTFEQIAQALEQVTGEKVQRKIRTVAEIQQAIEQQPMDIASRLAMMLVQQAGTTWPDSKTYRDGLIDYPSLVSVAQKCIKGSK